MKACNKCGGNITFITNRYGKTYPVEVDPISFDDLDLLDDGELLIGEDGTIIKSGISTLHNIDENQDYFHVHACVKKSYQAPDISELPEPEEL